MRSLRRRVWRILEPAPPGDRLSYGFDVFIRALITLNILAVIVETVPGVLTEARELFLWFEWLSVAIFTVEYLLRVWSATASERYRRPVLGRLRFALTPLALIDLMAILPAYLPAAGVDLRVLRGARLFRLFRILKIARYSLALRTLGRVFRRKRSELLATLTIVAFVLLIASTLLYYAEHPAQPETFSSIPRAMWWGVVTLTTVGYGDMVPVTALGRLLSGIFAISALLLIAVPTAILGAGFLEEFGASDPRRGGTGARGERPGGARDRAGGEDRESRPREESAGAATCPHCGGPLEEPHERGHG